MMTGRLYPWQRLPGQRLEFNSPNKELCQLCLTIGDKRFNDGSLTMHLDLDTFWRPTHATNRYVPSSHVTPTTTHPRVRLVFFRA